MRQCRWRLRGNEAEAGRSAAFAASSHASGDFSPLSVLLALFSLSGPPYKKLMREEAAERWRRKQSGSFRNSMRPF